MNKKIIIIVLIIALMIGGVILALNPYRRDDTVESTANSTILSEQVDEEESTEATSTDSEIHIYDIEKITTLQDGFLRIDPDCVYVLDWNGVWNQEENEDGSLTATFEHVSVGVPIAIPEEVFSSLELGSKIPKIHNLSNYWDDYKCVQIQDDKKFFVDSCYDSVDEAKEDNSLTICFDESCKDSKGNILVCTDADPDEEDYYEEYDYKDIDIQVKVKFASDAKIKYISAMDENGVSYDNVDFKSFIYDQICSAYLDFAQREWGVSLESWHGTGELRVTGNEEGEIVLIEEFVPAG